MINAPRHERDTLNWKLFPHRSTYFYQVGCSRSGTLSLFVSVLSTPVVSHFGSTFGLRPRLFASEGKVRPPAPVALLWRLAESVEGSHTPPFQPNWRRFRRATSPGGVRRGARVPTWSECRAECRVRCPRGVNNFPLKLVSSPLRPFAPTLSDFRPFLAASP